MIHGFNIPGLALKIDCIPGRINATWFTVKRSGVYFGQCHALCGVHHSSIPIRADIVKIEDFKERLKLKKVLSMDE